MNKYTFGKTLIAASLIMALTPCVSIADVPTTGSEDVGTSVAPPPPPKPQATTSTTPSSGNATKPAPQKAKPKKKKPNQKKKKQSSSSQQGTSLKDIPDPINLNSD